jgi:hypothetical protein
MAYTQFGFTGLLWCNFKLTYTEMSHILAQNGMYLKNTQQAIQQKQISNTSKTTI